MWQELLVMVDEGVPLDTMHILVVEAFADLMAHVLEEELTFVVHIHLHVGKISDRLHLSCLGVHLLYVRPDEEYIAILVLEHASTALHRLDHLTLLLPRCSLPQLHLSVCRLRCEV